MKNLNKTLSKNNIPDQIDFQEFEKLIPNLAQELNPYKQMFNHLLKNGVLEEPLSDSFDKNFLLSTALFMIRKEYISRFGFYLISQPFLNICADLFQDMNILEVGAGTGFLSHQLKNLNLNISAIDQKIQNNNYGFKNTYFDLIEDNAIDFLKNHSEFDLIIMSWPNYNSSFAYNILKNMRPKQKLLYIGEGFGGCTANDQFFDLLEKRTIELPETNLLQQYSSSWPSIHDFPFLYEIKSNKYSEIL
jgi:hypothetical protein